MSFCEHLQLCSYLHSADCSSPKFAQMLPVVPERSHSFHSLPLLNTHRLPFMRGRAYFCAFTPRTALSGYESVLSPTCLAVPCIPAGVSAGFPINTAVLTSLGTSHRILRTLLCVCSESDHEDGFRLTSERQRRLGKSEKAFTCCRAPVPGMRRAVCDTQDITES